MSETRRLLANGNTYCNECKKIRYRKWRDRPEGREKLRRVRRNYILKLRYDVSLQEFNRMLGLQNGRCAICGKVPDEGRSPALDHDHETGEARGILCHHCNAGLGHFREDPDIMRKAAEYLREHKRGDLRRLGSLLEGFEVEVSRAQSW
jgi:hypothetical protein